MKPDNQPIDINEVDASISLSTFLLVILAALTGAILAVKLLPIWIPGLSSTINNPDPKAFWFLSRGSAFAAYGLVWLSVVLGVGITNKLASLWPGLPPTIELHEYTSILGLAFGIFHGFILLGDHFIGFSLAQILLPFTTASYKPFLVGLGQTALYLWIILVVSFYVRKKIGSKTWRFLHFSSFLMFILALVHGFTTGTDSTNPLVKYFYFITTVTVVGLTIYRIIRAVTRSSQVKRKPVGSIQTAR
jgi:predicted ferric reductase